ncbi:hypothetical protein CL622_05440 [archaeon]|nr:hypothetical protein [archaeon]
MISNSSIKNLKFFKNSTNRKISEKQTTSVFATNEHNVESVMSRQGWPPDTIKNIIYPFNRTDFALFCHYCKVGLGGFYACNIQEKLQLEKPAAINIHITYYFCCQKHKNYWKTLCSDMFILP